MAVGGVSSQFKPVVWTSSVPEAVLGDGVFYKGPLPFTSPVESSEGIFSPTFLSYANLDVTSADAFITFKNAWDYFKDKHGRQNISDKNPRFNILLRSNPNAYFSTLSIEFKPNGFSTVSSDPQIGIGMSYDQVAGGSSNFKSWATLDIMAHEFAHGVTYYSAGLIYSGESGGLNEATSDIFGTLAEFYANNPSDIPDYLIGEKSELLRYMHDPKLDGKSLNCAPVDPQLDVHYLSGVANHFFYLLAEGSEGVGGFPASPTCNHKKVSGIGRDLAGDIWYKALTQCMLPSSNFCHARQCTLAVAEGTAKAAVSEAWDGVGVSLLSCGTLPGDRWEQER